LSIVHGGWEIIMSRSFEYLRPISPAEACELKAKYKGEAAFWAGGTDLLLEWKRGAKELDRCIDLTFLSDLRFIREEDEHTTIGALTPIAAIETYSQFHQGLSVLKEVTKQFATPQIRTIATLGGNLCHAVPSADFAVALIALDAEVKLMSLEGERIVPLEAFFKEAKQTALKEDELLVEITIPHPPRHSECAFQRVTRTSVDIALVNAAVRLMVDEKDCVLEARVALGAVAPISFRSNAAEELLLGKGLDEINEELSDQVGKRAAEETRPISDVRTTAAYRKHVSRVLVQRALVDAMGMLKGVGS
jgi:CO/xanthine dehydrogenase FAD-binding subunit